MQFSLRITPTVFKHSIFYCDLCYILVTPCSTCEMLGPLQLFFPFTHSRHDFRDESKSLWIRVNSWPYHSNPSVEQSHISIIFAEPMISLFSLWFPNPVKLTSLVYQVGVPSLYQTWSTIFFCRRPLLRPPSSYFNSTKISSVKDRSQSLLSCWISSVLAGSYRFTIYPTVIHLDRILLIPLLNFQ